MVLNLKRLLTYRTIFDLKGTKDYLHRWSLWLPLGLSIKIHRIMRTDEDRCEHDHPWWFIRFILWGGYTEQINGKLRQRKPWRPWAFWRIYPCLPSFRHRITKLPRKENWSLVICGRNKGDWGFFTKKGWVSWRKFLNYATFNRILWCDEGKNEPTEL